MRHEGKPPCLTKAHNERQWRGEGIGSRRNNLVYTKRQKDIFPNRKHETTPGFTSRRFHLVVVQAAMHLADDQFVSPSCMPFEVISKKAGAVKREGATGR